MINPIAIPVLLTSAINVSSSQTKLLDVNARLKATIKSIHQWLLISGVERIVICDGSGYDLTEHINELRLVKPEVDIEAIYFTNDVIAVGKWGKGYGEGEIINYALAHSMILKDAQFFAKCTGKLWVENFAACLGQFNGFASFDYKGWIKPHRIDTRFYIINKDYYLEKLANIYKRVDDKNGFYLEHTFRDGLAELRLSQYVMYPTPRIFGISGSMGIEYGQDKLKNILRDARSLLIKLAKL